MKQDRGATQVPSLTGLRGVAALWVVLFHAVTRGEGIGIAPFFPGRVIVRHGWAGVDLFFVLSGFMLMNAHADQFRSIDGRTLRRFAIGRFLRVYPLSAAALLLVLGLVMADPIFRDYFRDLAPGNLSLRAFVTTLALATRWLPKMGEWNEPTWSLSAELVGYALFPVLAWIAARVSSARIAVSASIGSALLFIVVQATAGRLGTNLIDGPVAVCRMLCFFAGGVFARRAAGLVGEAPRRHAAAATWLALVAIVALGSGEQSVSLLPLAFEALIFFLFVGGRDEGGVARLLGTRPAMVLGRVSFPLYLIHIMPLIAFEVHARRAGYGPGSFYLGALLLIVALLALSDIAHRLIEAPCHRLAKRWLQDRAAASGRGGSDAPAAVMIHAATRQQAAPQVMMKGLAAVRMQQDVD